MRLGSRLKLVGVCGLLPIYGLGFKAIYGVGFMAIYGVGSKWIYGVGSKWIYGLILSIALAAVGLMRI